MSTEYHRRERRHLVAYVILSLVIALAFTLMAKNISALRSESRRAQSSECQAVEILRNVQRDQVNALADFAEQSPAKQLETPEENAARIAAVEKARDTLLAKIGPAHRTCPPLS